MKGIIKQSGLTRKGQAATEFLMTYGWAILAIVIVAAVLWNMGVFKGQCAKTAPVQVFGSGEQLQVSDWSMNTSNGLTMTIKNLAGNDITISGGDMYNPTSPTEVWNGSAGSASVPAGGDATYYIDGGGSGTTGSCFTANINLTYSVQGGVTHPIRGTLRGKY